MSGANIKPALLVLHQLQDNLNSLHQPLRLKLCCPTLQLFQLAERGGGACARGRRRPSSWLASALTGLAIELHCLAASAVSSAGRLNTSEPLSVG
jgi:hypothetical protein